MEVPAVEFVECDGLSIAWQQWGSGPSLLVVPALLSNVEVSWEHEYYRRTYELAGEYLSVIQFDKRGIGLSDKITDVPTLDDRIRDMVAVLDAAGIERTSLYGLSEGGLMAQFFAAKHPERVDKVVLANSAPGVTMYRQLDLLNEAREAMSTFDKVFADWGRDASGFVRWFSPTNADNESFIRWATRFQRLSCTEAEIRRQLGSVANLDAYELLGEIVAETLVINARGDRVIPSQTGEAIAARIPKRDSPLLRVGQPFPLVGRRMARGDHTDHRVRERRQRRSHFRAPLRHRRVHRHRRVDGRDDREG